MLIPVLGSLGREAIVAPQGKGTGGTYAGGTAYYGAEALLKIGGITPVILSAIGNDLDVAWVRRSFAGPVNLDWLHKNDAYTSFYWQGLYEDGTSAPITVTLDNEVCATYKPDFDALRVLGTPGGYAYLGGFDPNIQLRCASCLSPSFVLTETLSYWIDKDRAAVLSAFEKSAAVVLTEDEYFKLRRTRLTPRLHNVDAAALLATLGLEFIVVTFAERGAQVFVSDGSFYVPAVTTVALDPTGAGNVFGGGLVGYLAKFGKFDTSRLAEAAAFGTVLAAAQVRDFGSRGLRAADSRIIERQHQAVLKSIQYL
jgi:sugar/nucleoside kinase (ribokinase family)